MTLGVFSEDNDEQPVVWSGVSFELKGFAAYHLSMMVMMLLGNALSFFDQAFVAIGIGLSVSILSAIRRLRHDWRWRPPGPAQVFTAILVAALMAYFVGATTGFSVSRFVTLGPWALAVVGIGVYSVLQALRIVHTSEKAFRAECGDQTQLAEPERPPEPRWKAIIRYAFITAFILVWLETVTSFYVFDSTFRAGSPAITVSQTEPLTNRGRIVYITPAEKQQVDFLQTVMMIGIPSSIALAFFLLLVLKVRLR